MRWMVVVWIFVTLSWAVSATADCTRTSAVIEELRAHQENLKFLEVTRTLEGGPYRPWRCDQGRCRRDLGAPRLFYLPDHPDADSNGMVAFANVSRDDEEEHVFMNYAELSILAKLRECRATYVKHDRIVLITYGEGSVAGVFFSERRDRPPLVFIANRSTN